MKKPHRAGCSAFLGFLVFSCIATLVWIWPSFIDAKGTQTTGTLVEKTEFVRVHYSTWTRNFTIKAAFKIAGQPLEQRAVCNVEPDTYASLRVGNPITVHYLPGVPVQPFFATSHVAPCTSAAAFSVNAADFHKILIGLGLLAVILLLWRLLRLKIAAWLLFPWFFLVMFYVLIPNAEPEPSSQRRSAPATVEKVATITKLAEGIHRTSPEDVDIPLQHPYQIVALRFTPQGVDEPVVAVDKVDLNSVPNLAEGQTVDIDYDLVNPRIAQIHGGTREFPHQAVGTAMIVCACLTALIFLALLFKGILRIAGSLLLYGIRSRR